MLPPDGTSCKIYEKEKPSSGILEEGGDEEREGKKDNTLLFTSKRERWMEILHKRALLVLDGFAPSELQRFHFSPPFFFFCLDLLVMDFGA